MKQKGNLVLGDVFQPLAKNDSGKATPSMHSSSSDVLEIQFYSLQHPTEASDLSITRQRLYETSLFESSGTEVDKRKPGRYRGAKTALSLEGRHLHTEQTKKHKRGSMAITKTTYRDPTRKGFGVYLPRDQIQQLRIIPSSERDQINSARKIIHADSKRSHLANLHIDASPLRKISLIGNPLSNAHI